MSVLELQIAILEESQDSVRGLLNEIDRKTENDAFKRAAHHFGFQTIEHHGRRVAMRREIAQVMGYVDESGLRKLCEKWDLETLPLGTFGQNVRMLAIEKFGLHPNDGKSVFIGWDAFLLSGMSSTTNAAQQVQLYLLNAEKAGRIAAGARELAAERKQKIDEGSKVVSMLAKIDKMNNVKLRSKAAEYIDDLLDGALAIGKQSDIFPDTEKDPPIT